MLAPTLLVLLLAGQQQVHAWWLFSAPAAAPATSAPARARQLDAPSAALAEAKFDMDGVVGSFRFSRRANQTTLVEYALSGLRGNNKLYHVHVRPVPKFDAERVRHNATAIGELCADPATGGHLNPHRVTDKLPPKSAPLERYELGDLSGKHGPLAEAPGRPDHYQGSFVDPRLPLAGEHSIVGRSLVIHKNGGARWVCASIEPL